MEFKRVIVDCDAGIDDAVALIILIAAHKEKRIRIEAITCVTGNTHVDNVIRNVYRTLQICDALDIPVYGGAHAPLLKTESSKIAAATAEDYHGSDGFADVFEDVADTSRLRPEHAVMALQKIASENPGEISLVCLAPLTNVALTLKMFPGFAACLKELYIMGGNSTGKGNTTSQAEFNFYADPESAHIVLNNVDKPLYLLPWETCLTSNIEPEWRHEILGCLDNKIVRFMNTLESRAYPKDKQATYEPCDGLLAAIVVRPDTITSQDEIHADVELHGNRTRGQVVLDHLLTRKPNVRIVTSYDSQKFKDTLISAVKL